MAEKRYFWLKLQQDFFGRKEIKMLRRIAGGDTYTVIYLKMLLKSLQTNGKLYYEGISNDFIEEIALDIDEDYENVSVTVNYLRSKGLLIDSGVDEVELTSVKSLVGSESSGAERKRRQRERERTLIETKRDNVTGQSRLGHVEIELEKEIDIEKEQEVETPAMPTDLSVRQQIMQTVGENGFSDVLSPHQLELLVDYVEADGLSVDVIAKAIADASDKNIRKFNYIKAILEAKVKQGIKTLADWEVSEGKHQQKQVNDQVPDWMQELNDKLEGS
ncbi:phage replisome organizer N-terminal domain-containing protein [Weissella cibaria]|uniref:phage replisome organizer N-terminal domain-containing protein n=1 Tax=Weissella cibaria TaxID=137591 RepID=UPI001194E3A4|nr:phage replisome organizer N-terminal domain-containing protein [Weissella cibaria]MCS8562447.1 DnaD domain protein [Weissella cibaria]MCS8566392.1 DnaD domain protein [Weissella cibaria]MCS8576200.1 DnaD domain protein [Weissella cibaria]TVV37858.1 DnaD domain protein [Weissella cibaria]UNW40321.1 phage replisome organizer N-terminal domain-containing protein [Weissella cibaria]